MEESSAESHRANCCYRLQRCRPRHFAPCTVSSCCGMTDVRSCTSMSQLIPQLFGPLSRLRKLFLKTQPHAICSGIETVSMARSLAAESQACRSKRCSPPHAHPGRNPYVERLIGSIRRECLDYVIVMGEDHLRRIVREYFDYYHEGRPHQALAKNSPVLREVEPPAKGKTISIPQVGGLHHRYRRAA